MNLNELKKEIAKYQYLEDTDIIDVSLASIIATRLKLGDPVWLVLIGPSSGGKSQILRPLALTDPKFLFRVDDLTENTFLSGAKSGDKQMSLLHRIGPKGMIIMSDLTVLFSKMKESRAAILSQLRMIYDGEMNKSSGSSDKSITWKGYLGILAGSTPSIYQHFEEVADMGERFIYYRMKEYDAEKATALSMKRKIFGKELDQTLSNLYSEYIKDVVTSDLNSELTLSEEVQKRILRISMFAEKIRTPIHTDWKKTDIDRIPVSAMPMRVALQLTALAKGLQIIRYFEGEVLSERDYKILDWCGYSLANEEKRACLGAIASFSEGLFAKTQIIADKVGLSTSITGNILQNLAAVGVITRSGDATGLSWKIKNQEDWLFVRKIENIETTADYIDRELSEEDKHENKDMLEDMVKHLS